MLIAALLSLLLLQTFALVLPGPDFFTVLRASIRYGRNSGVLVALGISSGALTYVTLVVLLLDYLKDNFLMLVHWIGLFGGCYLLYIAYNCFKSSKGNHSLESNNSEVVKLSKGHLWLSGYLCNLSNPKAIVFFVSLLPLFVLKSSALWYHLSILIVMFFSTWIWFSFVAYVMGSQRVRNVFARQMAKLEIVFSVILTIFALLLIYSFVESVIM
ncbi:MAG: LysE family translocator [Proteobacteria bacterium]|nr:LysE family translocator [Pseudomonadota bacterium]